MRGFATLGVGEVGVSGQLIGRWNNERGQGNQENGRTGLKLRWRPYIPHTWYHTQ